MNLLRLYIVLLIVSPNLLKANHPYVFEKDFKLVKNFYLNLNIYTFKMNLEVQFNNVVNSNIKVDATVKDTNSYIVIDGTSKSINGSNYSITLNSEESIMTISKRNTQIKSLKENIVNLSDTTFSIDSISYEGSKRIYKLSFMEGPVSWIEMSVDTLTGIVYKYTIQNSFDEEYEWKKIGKRKVVMSFIDFRKLESTDEALFKETTYIRKVKGRYTPVSPYLSYRILDLNAKH